MRTGLILLSAWIGVSMLMALCWSIAARLGYRRAIEDVRAQATDAADATDAAAEKVIYLDDVEKLVS